MRALFRRDKFGIPDELLGVWVLNGELYKQRDYDTQALYLLDAATLVIDLRTSAENLSKETHDPLYVRLSGQGHPPSG